MFNQCKLCIYICGFFERVTIEHCLLIRNNGEIDRNKHVSSHKTTLFSTFRLMFQGYRCQSGLGQFLYKHLS